MTLFAKIPTSILRAPAHHAGLLVASDRPSVANVYGPHGYDEGVPSPALSLVKVVTATRNPCGMAQVVATMREMDLDVTGPLSTVQCLRDPGLRAALEAKGFDGYAGRTRDGRDALEVAWVQGTFGIVREDRASAGTLTVDDGGLSIGLTTMGRQLALDLLHEGLEVARTARGHGATEDVEAMARRHVLTWLVDRCTRPEGARFAFDGDALVSRVGADRFVDVTLLLDVQAAADAGLVELPPARVAASVLHELSARRQAP